MSNNPEEQPSPMSREDLIFALGQAHGMLSRMLSDCELLVRRVDDLSLKAHVASNVQEARQMQRKHLNRFYGVTDKGEHGHD